MKVSFVLVRPRNPLNIGAAARAVANFGFSDLVIVDPYEPVIRDAKSAVGAEKILKKAKVVKSVLEAVTNCSHVMGTSCGEKRTTGPTWINPDLIQHTLKGTTRVAILFGSENNGLSNDDLNFCQSILKIPTSSVQPSMNLSHTVAVVAYLLSSLRGPRARGNLKPESAGLDCRVLRTRNDMKIEERERLVQSANEACGRVGFFSTWNSKRREKELREAIYRWSLNKKDIAMLHGIFRCLKK